MAKNRLEAFSGKCLWLAVLMLILIASYSVLGILQAASLYEGERALFNLHFWGAIMMLSLVSAAACGFFAIRTGRKSR